MLKTYKGTTTLIYFYISKSLDLVRTHPGVSSRNNFPNSTERFEQLIRLSFLRVFSFVFQVKPLIVLAQVHRN